MIKKAIAALAATPMAVYAIRHLARHDANIIYYHHVGGACPHYDAFYAGCTASRFADDLHWLSRLFTFAPLDEILERSPATRASRRPRLAITFDDGFNLCRPEMIDILDRYGIKATTFVITSCLDNARLMWRHMLSVIQSLVPEEVWRARFDQLAIERNFASAAPGESVLRATRSWPPHSKDAWAEALWGRCGLRPRAEYLEANKPVLHLARPRRVDLAWPLRRISHAYASVLLAFACRRSRRRVDASGDRAQTPPWPAQSVPVLPVRRPPATFDGARCVWDGRVSRDARGTRLQCGRDTGPETRANECRRRPHRLDGHAGRGARASWPSNCQDHNMTISGVRILFVVENDYFPRDMRVYNEAISLSRDNTCYVFAPRQQGQGLVERIDAVTCFRYPNLEAASLKWLVLEYALAAFWIGVCVPLLVLRYRIQVVHVANPPDFVIPIVCWLKLVGTKFVYDVHDLSVATFQGKARSQSRLTKVLEGLLKAFELASLRISDAIIATNESIQDHMARRSGNRHPIHVVRNSNPVVFAHTEDVRKASRFDRVMHVGYFGVLANDEAAGLENFFVVAHALARQGARFRFSIVGSGPGLPRLRRMAAEQGMQHLFTFHGFVAMPDALQIIKEFDFGLVTWGDLPKNHLHTAMKVMDYMCCAVPVCSLRLKEQMNSTRNIGIHAASFEEVAARMVALYGDRAAYETLRQRTLQHFNSLLSWAMQERNLFGAYAALLAQ